MHITLDRERTNLLSLLAIYVALVDAMRSKSLLLLWTWASRGMRRWARSQTAKQLEDGHTFDCRLVEIQRRLNAASKP